MNNRSGVQWVYFGAAPNTSSYVPVFYNSLSDGKDNTYNQQGPQYGAYGWTVGLEFTSPKNSTSTQDWGVVALPSTNQGSVAGSNNLGVSIPVGFKLFYANNNTYRVGFQPQQVAAADIGIYGFTCTGWTCTSVDGSQWTVTNPAGGYNNQVNLQLSAG